MKLTWSGVNEMAQAFQRLSESVRGEILSSTAIAGALPIENQAKELCPVKTGNLRRSIETRFGESSGAKATALVGSAVDYAPYVEFGTGRRGSESAEAGPGPYREGWAGMPASAFLRGGFDEAGEKAKKEMAATFAELVTEEIQNLGPRGGEIKS